MIILTQPAAQIDGNEAEQIVLVQEGGWVHRAEWNLGARPLGDEGIWLGNIDRFTKTLSELLREGESLKPCRQALDLAGFPFKTVGGTMIVVHPYQYRRVQRAVKAIELKPSYIIFAESLEYLISPIVALY